MSRPNNNIILAKASSHAHFAVFFRITHRHLVSHSPQSSPHDTTTSPSALSLLMPCLARALSALLQLVTIYTHSTEPILRNVYPGNNNCRRRRRRRQLPSFIVFLNQDHHQQQQQQKAFTAEHRPSQTPMEEIRFDSKHHLDEIGIHTCILSYIYGVSSDLSSHSQRILGSFRHFTRL